MLTLTKFILFRIVDMALVHLVSVKLIQSTSNVKSVCDAGNGGDPEFSL